MHRLAAQELADRGAQYCAAICAPRVGSWTSTFQLQFDGCAIWAGQFAEHDRAAVAELSGPMAKLMAAIVGRVWLHAWPQRIAAEHGCRFRRLHQRIAQPELLRKWLGIRQQLWRLDRRWLHARPQRAGDLASVVACFRITGQCIEEVVQ